MLNLRWEASKRGFLAGLETRPTSDAVQRVFDALGILEPTTATRLRLERWFAQAATQDVWAVAFNALAIGAMCTEFQLA